MFFVTRMLARSVRNSVICSLVALVATALVTSSVHAQDPEAVAPPAPAAVEPAPAAAEPAAAPAAAHGEAPSGGGGHQKSKFMWFIESSGWIGAILLIMSMYFIATVSKLFYELKLEREMPEEVVAEANALIDQRDYNGAYTRLRADDSMFSRVAASGLAELNKGMDEARHVMEHSGEVEVVEMEKRISMLAVLGTLGPMIGLLGTLKGMIASFAVIALSDTQLKASEVAGGISEALLLTFEGVALSVPAIYLFAVFRNRVSSISTQVMYSADEFLRRVAASGRAAKQPATAYAATANVPARG